MMTFKSLGRIFWGLLFTVLLLLSLTLVVSNQQLTSLNLLVIELTAVPIGLIVLLSFVLGCLLGLVASLFIYRVLALRWQLRQSERELAELRKQTIRPIPLSK
ncbi:LapA family protein [Agitococcus lubricus]|uniref:Uncharacterized protein DUF1049 n=1 Tax=Agitococcus lubricus TaxID=1077255 RepID=A0A2T5IYZ0_9GAMM|nr:LapA family protein [Agitococcus lubricus]PTQ89229.1 uncharacterized protein DUF1049 [Agitococcus lubricus]